MPFFPELKSDELRSSRQKQRHPLHGGDELSLTSLSGPCHYELSLSHESGWIYGFEYGLQTGFVDGLVGDGLLLSDCDSLWEMRAVGAFRAFLTPSVGFLSLLSGGDVVDVLGGRVLIRRGTKALRISSVGESLLDVLPLGGDLDGLLDRMPAVAVVVEAVVVMVVVPAVSAAYSEYLMASNVYGGKTGGKPGLNRSAGGGIGIAPDVERER